MDARQINELENASQCDVSETPEEPISFMALTAIIATPVDGVMFEGENNGIQPGLTTLLKLLTSNPDQLLNNDSDTDADTEISEEHSECDIQFSDSDDDSHALADAPSALRPRSPHVTNSLLAPRRSLAPSDNHSPKIDSSFRQSF